jgi:hypothetical protein
MPSNGRPLEEEEDYGQTNGLNWLRLSSQAYICAEGDEPLIP